MIAIIAITAFSLLGSFVCSLTEAALYSIPRSRIVSLERKGNRGAKRLAKLRTKIDEPIAAILTLNTAVNTLGAAWAGALVGFYYGDTVLGFFSAGFTAMVLFFSEIIPKSLGVTFAHKVAPRLAFFIQILIFIFWPFVKMSVALTHLWGKNSHLNYPTEEDIISLARLSHQGGVILPEEAKWISNVLRLNNLSVRDIMTPKSVVYTVPESLKLSEIQVSADRWRFSRIPVHREGKPDEIVGIVRRREVFVAVTRGSKKRLIRDIMIPADIVSDKLLAHKLLNRFISTRRHLFVVHNRYGKYIGVVTLEDALESLIGAEIVDEHDLYEDMQVLAKMKKSKSD